MKAEELRIGNYFRLTGDYNEAFHYLVVTELSEGFVNKFHDKNLEPILLTEEWLLKFGFERLPWGFVIKGNEDKAVLIRFSYKPNFKLWLEVGNGLRTELRYVHQLQNLYHALTDLTITADKPTSEGEKIKSSSRHGDQHVS